ncbi:MarR family winged helix-turn-helix transcriptional regulator [Microbacterium tumbae]
MARSIAQQSTELRLATFRLARRLRSELALGALTDTQFGALAVLNRFGPHTLSELAQRERVSAPSMKRTTHSLEESGYLTKELDDADRRRFFLAITPAGAEVVRTTIAQRDAWLTARLRTLDAESREVLARAAQIMERFATE